MSRAWNRGQLQPVQWRGENLLIFVLALMLFWLLPILPVLLAGLALLALRYYFYQAGPLAAQDLAMAMPSRAQSALWLTLALVLLAGSLLIGLFSHQAWWLWWADFYQAGTLVMGGGPVVLPLLQASLIPQWLNEWVFLSGYALAQAMPGPLFNLAGF